MNNERLTQFVLTKSNVKISGNRDTESICIEIGDDAIYIHELADLEVLKDVMYDLVYWWNEKPKEVIE